MVIKLAGNDVTFVHKANAAGLAVQALSDWRIRSSEDGGLLLSFTNIVSESMARQVAQQLRSALINNPEAGLRGPIRLVTGGKIP